MKRTILDTNIYGLIVKDKERNNIREKIENKRSVIVYGLPLIRKELRDTPKNIRVGGVNLRNDLLSIYDSFIANHKLKFLAESNELAESYFAVYKELGGFASKEEIGTDFIIVACASLNSLDIIVSGDRRTMLSDTALKSYNIVNKIRKVKPPRFLNYEEFKKELK